MRLLFTFILLISLCACEAPLVLDGVEANKKSSVRRTDVFMAASDNGSKSIIVGSDGLVILADSGTSNWTRHQIEGRPVLIDVASCPNGMFALLSIEGAVIISNDNGQTWSHYKLPTAESPQAITCNIEGVIWVAGSFSTISSSHDGGLSWNDHSLNEDIILSTIQFLDEHQGIITGEFGTVLLTEDSGKTWHFAEPIPNEFFPLASVFKNHQQGWIAGLSGIVYSTNDGGQSWQQENTQTNAPLFGISLKNDNIIAVGDYGTVIHRDINGSTDSWKALEVSVDSRFFFRGSTPLKDNKLIIAGGAGSLELVDLANMNSLK